MDNIVDTINKLKDDEKVQEVVKEVLDKVLRDKLFIDASGGGMTVSGGECLIDIVSRDHGVTPYD